MREVRSIKSQMRFIFFRREMKTREKRTRSSVSRTSEFSSQSERSQLRYYRSELIATRNDNKDYSFSNTVSVSRKQETKDDRKRVSKHRGTRERRRKI